MNNKKKILTDTSRFLLPCFGIPFKRLEELGFLNSYLYDKNREKVNDKDIHIYLLFKPSGNQLYLLQKKIEDFESKDKHNIVLLEDYDYDHGYIVIVFKFPERFRKDYNLFLQGKYSQFSDEFKDFFPEQREVNFESETLRGKQLQWMVIHKYPKYKKLQEEKYGFSLDLAPEIYHLPIEEDETLDIDKIYEKWQQEV